MDDNINAFRSFNRFYTGQIGLLNQTLLETEYSLSEGRILFEIGMRPECTASDLIEALGMDRGYVSRMLKSFEGRGLIRRTRSENDSRERFVKLTAKGKKAFGVVNHRSSSEAQNLLEKLTPENRERLLQCMKTIQFVLQPMPVETAVVTLRSHQPGDIGWITYRHGVLYFQEYGWDETFEALVAGILVKFVNKHDPERERIWIAEMEGERVGSVMIVDSGDDVAQLRLLLVEPWARGRKIGKRLTDECVSFAKAKGYKKIKLWTQNNLHSAARLYTKTGFKIIQEEPHRSFGHDLVAQTWELPLAW